jgi:hypothetical protein
MNIQNELPPLRSLPKGHDQAMRAALVRELRSSTFPANTRQPLRRRLLTSAFAGIVTVSILIAAVVVGAWQTGDRFPGRSATPVPISSRGPLPSNVIADCVESYDLTTLKHRAFAFDGTVTHTAVLLPPTDGSGVPNEFLLVTFTVNEWFRGGDQSTITLDMIAPWVSSDQQIRYGVGTRLLVSGAPRFGGSPLQAAIAWGCGFTRYYDKETATSWHLAFSQNG